MKVVDRDGEFNYVLLLLVPVIGSVGMLIEEPSRISPISVGVVSTICVACLGSLIFILREQLREDEFRAWVGRHAALLMSGGSADYRGAMLQASTVIHQYVYVYAFIFVRFEARGRPMVEATDRRHTHWGYNAVTLLLGWWWLPLGPVSTVRAVRRNLRGGEAITVGEYLRTMGTQGPQSAANINPM